MTAVLRFSTIFGYPVITTFRYSYNYPTDVEYYYATGSYIGQPPWDFIALDYSIGIYVLVIVYMS